MNNHSVMNKLNELKKIIKNTSAGCETDSLTEFIMLTAMSEIELRKNDVNKSEIEMKIDEAIKKLSIPQVKNQN